MDVSALPALAAELVRDYPFLDAAHANRLAHAYGTRAGESAGQRKSIADLGQAFGATLTESEVRYLMSANGPAPPKNRVAPIQAGIADVAGRNSRPRRMDGRPSQPR